MPIQAAKAGEDRNREFIFTDRDFKSVVTLVHEKAGIALSEHKQELVYSRLARRLRVLKMQKFSDYLNHVRSSEGADEIGNLINAITTNLTAFFREGHHFEHLRDKVVAPLADGSAGARKQLLVWSAGCSTGEEPFSIAMTIADAMPNWQNSNVRILATDLDTNAVATCRAARYRKDLVQPIHPGLKKQFLCPAGPDEVTIDPKLRKMISFKQLNLRGSWPMRKKYDVIFCRNVMIYFDDAFKTELLQGFYDRLKPGGHLYIGHSESASKFHDGFRLIGRTIYERGQ